MFWNYVKLDDAPIQPTKSKHTKTSSYFVANRTHIPENGTKKKKKKKISNSQ